MQLRTFHSARFLREIHHFLWTPPQTIQGTMDAGWSCRDHALITGILLESFGHRAMLVHGEALFVKGPTGKTASLCYTQRPHNWLLVENVGAVDISIKPAFDSGEGEIRLPLSSVFANQWHPIGKGQVHFVNDAGAFALAEHNLPQKRNHATAVYFTREVEHIHHGHITHSAGWIGSALTHWLQVQYGDPVALYAALMLHLHALVTEATEPLAGLTVEESWSRLAARRDDAIARAGQLLVTTGTSPGAGPVTTQNINATCLQNAARKPCPSA